MSPSGALPIIQDLRALEAIVPLAVTVLGTWFACMALTGWLAGRRGRADGLWTVLAIFSGPIALLAVLLLPRLERSPDPESFAGLPVVTTAPEWPQLDPPSPAITVIERFLSAAAGAVIGGIGASVAASFAAVEGPAMLVLVGAASGAIVGYALSGSLIDADRTRVLGVGLLAGVLVISVLALVTALAGALTGVDDFVDLLVLPLALVGAALLPLVLLITGVGVFAVTLPGGIVWAFMTDWVIRATRRHSPRDRATPRRAIAS